MAFSIKNVRLDGCLFGPASGRDYRTVFKDREVPDRVDLRQYCTPVEDQGQIGSCTANATVGALEFHYKRRDGRAPDLSRMFTYYNARRLRGDIVNDTGAFIREAMASVMAFGVCREDVWPYDPNLFAAEPSPQAYQDARIHEAIEYARVAGGAGAISALAEGLPVVFGIALPGRCYEEAARTALIPRIDEAELRGPDVGGHSMLIVGYDKADQTFLLRNSWGANWGDQGYCRIPFDVMDMAARPEDFWVVAELAKSQGFQLVRPGKATAPAAPAAPARSLALDTSKLRDQLRSSLEADLAASSRKIESLIAGTRGMGGQPKTTSLQPCTACAGSGICPFCHGRTAGCTRCNGRGACSECGGTGII
jgi:hypothetical protein